MPYGGGTYGGIPYGGSAPGSVAGGAGAFTFIGAATGTVSEPGGGSGAFVFTGTAVGVVVDAATGAGTYVFSGTATGTAAIPVAAWAYFTFTGTATGTAIAEPEASAAPTSLAFGSAPINLSSGAQTITVTNIGSADLIVGQAVIGGTNPGDFDLLNDRVSNTTIPVSGSATLQIDCIPLALGSRTASLSIPSNDPATPLTIALSATGVAVPAIPPVFDPLSNHSIRYLLTTLDPVGGQVGQVIAELPCTSVTFSLTINQAGPFSATFSIEDWTMRYGTDWIKATNPGKTFFWVEVDGVLMYGGRVQQRDPVDSQGNVTIIGEDFYGYWVQRLQAPQDYGSYQLTYTTNAGVTHSYSLPLLGGPAPLIAWRLFRVAAAQPDSLSNLTFPQHGRGLGTTSDPDEWISVSPEQITFSSPLSSMATIDSLVQELTALGFGVGLEISSGFEFDGAGNPHAYTYLDFPRLGTALADYTNPGGPPVLDLSTALDVKWNEDASSQATAIVEMLGAAGGNSADEVFYRPAIDDYHYPLTEAPITHTTTPPTIGANTVQAQLEKGDRVTHSFPQVAPVVTLPAFPVAFTGTDFNLTTGIGTQLGNDVTVWNPVNRQADLAGGGTYTGAVSSLPFPPPGFSLTMRVVRIDVTINDSGVSTMDLTLNQPPADVVPPPPTYDVDY